MELVCDFVEPSIALMWLLGDAFRLRQCLINLVGAAGSAPLPLLRRRPAVYVTAGTDLRRGSWDY